MREAGVLMPVASLPGAYGIGDFGPCGYRFADWISKTGAGIWQILPLNPLGYGNSPYQPFSSYAGDEIYISLELLYEDGLLKEKPEEIPGSVRIDYEAVRNFKKGYLWKAFEAFQGDEEYYKFIEQDWVYPYGVFRALKAQNGERCWLEWPKEQKDWITDRRYDISGLDREIRFICFTQYLFYKQWMRLKSYANEKGIRIMGDVPFYVGIDSLDVWANREDFLLDAEGKPVFIAGVPPDCFSETGQRWGNPLYNWEALEKKDFRFWIERLGYCKKLFDIIRIDHFRAFDTYWKIPASCPTAIDGEWKEAPGYQVFDTVLRKLPGIRLVAEDLGADRPSVYRLRDHYNFKGMKLMEFINPFDTNEEIVMRPQMAVYTGTHDNQTVMGWYQAMDAREKQAYLGYLEAYGLGDGTEADFAKAMVRWTLADPAELAILPMPDILGLDDSARINEPGTLGSPNWEWKLESMEAAEEVLPFFSEAVAHAGRSAKAAEPGAAAEEAGVEPGVTAGMESGAAVEADNGTSGGAFETPKADPVKLLEVLLQYRFGKDASRCSEYEVYLGLLELVKFLARDRKKTDTGKKVYYISAEFLIGRMLANNLINLGIYDILEDHLNACQKSIGALENLEPEPSLGNGGLGRLAACFLDSIASTGLNGDGIGLNYHFGLFKQEFENHKQKETVNPWLTYPSWLKKSERSYEVSFGNRKVVSVLYDMDVTGYENRTNTLHLFDVESVDEGIVGEGIGFDKEAIEKNLTLFLYPDDSDEAGKLLRIYQQYFMVSNAAQLILDECLDKCGDLHRLYDYAVIQINDTHPSMVIPELIRLLTERGIGFDEAVEIVKKTCAYTNHTILAEALEKWPVEYMKKAVPQLLPIIEVLDDRVRRKFGDEQTAIIDRDERVHMANMDIHYGFSVNGVAALHTEILKESELHAFYKLYPEKFNNKTNGITFRRWLLSCNRPLAAYLETLIGPEFKKNADCLKELLKYGEDADVLETLLSIKQGKKQELKEYLEQTAEVSVDVNSVFDIQIKRLHEYKRQQMNVLYLIYKYLEIKNGKKPARPITMIFGAKAAPAYETAKDIIHAILCLQELVNHSPEVSPYLKVVMVENYNVTKAEKLIPACDISEQISLASKEASGTGNMKFMLNGAVTLGTMDGANVEIYDLVGDENIYIFGASSSEVISHYGKGDYSPALYYGKDREITEWVDFLTGDELLSIGEEARLRNLHRELTEKDWFMTLLDVRDYIEKKEQALADYENRMAWAKKMLVNIANAGYFSSDRTIGEYNRDIWKL